jgi:hypothetical protein
MIPGRRPAWRCEYDMDAISTSLKYHGRGIHNGPPGKREQARAGSCPRESRHGGFHFHHAELVVP